MNRRWLRPRFTILALLVLITLCAPFLAYIASIRRGNEQRKAAFDDALAKGMRLEPSHTAPLPQASPKPDEADVRKLWSNLLGNPNLPHFARVKIHDFFGKNRPRPPITDADLKSLEYLPELEDFDFYYSNDVTDEGLAVLGKLPKLKRIVLNDLKHVTGEFLGHFSEDNVVETIWMIDLKGMDGGELADLRRFKNLKQLWIIGTPLLESAAMDRVGLPSGVTELHLNGVSLSDKTVPRWLSQVQLERLEISVPISKITTLELAKQAHLTHLKLSNARLEDNDFEFLESLEKLKSLQLSGMPVRGELLDNISKPEQISVLGFNSTLFTDENLKKLARYQKLFFLDLAYTPLTGEGFAADVRWPVIENLWLSGTQFSESGKTAFANLPELQEVYMPGNWSFEDLSRFNIKGAKFQPIINGVFIRPEGFQQAKQILTYMPTINQLPLSEILSEEMKPVADLHSRGMAERQEWDRRSEPNP